MTEVLFQSFQSGTSFANRYRFVRMIQSGGMGAVYEVVDLKTQWSRALKIMHPTLSADLDLRARFLSEAQITAPVRSDHIVQVLDAGVDDLTELPFIVMELLQGEDLAAALRRIGHFAPAEVVELLTQVALALDRTLSLGIIHRDLKPENLYLTKRDNGALHLKVLDFGIAKVIEASGNRKTTRNLGTPLFMAPEQMRGDHRIGPATDLYALGHIAFALLAGEAYFATEARKDSSHFGLCSKIVRGLPEPATQRAARLGVTLPPAFDAWFAKAVALEVSERFQTPHESIRELSAALRATCQWPSAQKSDANFQRSTFAPTLASPMERMHSASRGVYAAHVDSTSPLSSSKGQGAALPKRLEFSTAMVAGVAVLGLIGGVTALMKHVTVKSTASPLQPSVASLAVPSLSTSAVVPQKSALEPTIRVEPSPSVTTAPLASAAGPLAKRVAVSAKPVVPVKPATPSKQSSPATETSSRERATLPPSNPSFNENLNAAPAPNVPYVE